MLKQTRVWYSNANGVKIWEENEVAVVLDDVIIYGYECMHACMYVCVGQKLNGSKVMTKTCDICVSLSLISYSNFSRWKLLFDQPLINPSLLVYVISSVPLLCHSPLLFSIHFRLRCIVFIFIILLTTLWKTQIFHASKL